MNETRHYDYLIIGGGPAGLQLGYFLDRAGRSYHILEAANQAGAFFERFPRHRTLISINKVYTGYTDPETNLRWDWNSLLSDDPDLLFREFSQAYWPDAEVMVRYLDRYATQCGLRISYNVRVTRVHKEGGRFELTDQEGGTWSCQRLVVATGLFQPYRPAIPGIELVEDYVDVSVNAQDFVNQTVLVLGKGNSGFETANHLTETASIIHLISPHPVRMAWKTHHVGNLRAVNNNFLDTYQLKSQNAVLDANIERIVRREDGKLVVSVAYNHAEGEREELVYDRVINCTGFRFDTSIFDDTCRPELAIHDRFPAQTSEWESTNVKDLYVAGTLMQMRDYKKITSGFIHGFRYNLRCLHKIFEHKYHGVPFPSRPVAATVEGMAEAILARLNRTSALWQQFSFLGDLIVVDQSGTAARYYEELPVAYIHESPFGRERDYYVVTLEFGKVEGDPFNIPRSPVPEQAPRSTFLHPVIRRFNGDRQLSELHLLENLYGEWRHPEQHVQPLTHYLEGELAPVMPMATAS